MPALFEFGVEDRPVSPPAPGSFANIVPSFRTEEITLESPVLGGGIPEKGLEARKGVGSELRNGFDEFWNPAEESSARGIRGFCFPKLDKECNAVSPASLTSTSGLSESQYLASRLPSSRIVGITSNIIFVFAIKQNKQSLNQKI